MKSAILALSALALVSAAPSFAASAKGAAVKIELGTGTPKNKEEMVFSKATLSVKAGAKVTLTFKNNSTSKGMTHNFVLVKPGKAQAVIDASVAAGPDKGWVAESADIIAKGKLVDAGESETIEFTAPSEPGEYPYICTFPGHTTMKGTMKVTK
ncbi:MAG: cupredoxin domain-containing protein [Bdellovibrionales bacterium]|nr:cupredoxin domain-containing protein [Bdellovibrionales bacterium]